MRQRWTGEGTESTAGASGGTEAQTAATAGGRGADQAPDQSLEGFAGKSLTHTLTRICTHLISFPRALSADDVRVAPLDAVFI